MNANLILGCNSSSTQADTSSQGPIPESFRRARHGEDQDATVIPDTKSHEDFDGDMTFMWVILLARHLATEPADNITTLRTAGPPTPPLWRIPHPQGPPPRGCRRQLQNPRPLRYLHPLPEVVHSLEVVAAELVAPVVHGPVVLRPQGSGVSDETIGQRVHGMTRCQGFRGLCRRSQERYVHEHAGIGVLQNSQAIKSKPSSELVQATPPEAKETGFAAAHCGQPRRVWSRGREGWCAPKAATRSRAQGSSKN